MRTGWMAVLCLVVTASLAPAQLVWMPPAGPAPGWQPVGWYDYPSFAPQLILPVQSPAALPAPPSLPDSQVGEPVADAKKPIADQVDEPGKWFQCACHASCKYWFAADYLLWWIKPQPLPTLLTGDSAPITVFDFTMPVGTFELYPLGSVVLVGGDQHYGGFSGGRTTVGMWLDAPASWGVEVSGFDLESRTRYFSIATNGFGRSFVDPTGFGQPYLAIPYVVGNPGVTRIGPTALPFSSFGNQAANDQAIDGAFFFSTSSKMWGIEGNAIYNLARGASTSWDLLGGLRFLHLAENVTYTAIEQDSAERDTIATDFFGGTTDFYGLQVGTRLQADRNRWSCNLAAKVALGVNAQEVRIQGNSAQVDDINGNPPNPVGGGPFPYGIFALRTNIGHHNAADFSVVPEVQLKIGYRLTPRLRALFGYNFLYWINVVRPGNQIDNVVISTTYNTGGGGPEGLDQHIRQFNSDGTVAQPGTAAGAVGRPGVLFNQSDFWAHGVSAGLEYSW